MAEGNITTSTHPAAQSIQKDIDKSPAPQLSKTNVAPGQIAAVQLDDGTTYTFFYDKTPSPPTLNYQRGPAEDSSYSTSSITTAVINSKPGALAATVQGIDIHVFYADPDNKVQQIIFNLATKTWKKGTYADKVTTAIADGTGITASSKAVLKVHFIDKNDTTSLSEAYFTEGTWSVRKISNV